MLADQFRDVMRQLVSGVAVIATRDGSGRQFGMAATSLPRSKQRSVSFPTG